MEIMRLPLRRCLRRKNVMIITFTIALFIVISGSYNAKLSDDGEGTDDTFGSLGLYSSNVINTDNIDKYASETDLETIPDFKQDIDLNKLTAWSQKPKETWHGYFQNIFNNYNMSWTGKSYPEIQCDSEFKPTLTENMAVISGYPFDVESVYLRELSLDDDGIRELSKPLANPRKYPVLVTASSSNHYKESQGLIQTYHQKLLPLHKDLKMIYYDIGLDPDQREELERNCRCEVRTFQTSKFPKHVADKHGFAWKPVIIQTTLKEFDLVMWMDASVRFVGNSLDEVSLRTRQRGFQGMHGAGAVCERTSKKPFAFLQENACLFNYPEFEATWMSISRNRFTLEYIMKPWVLCGLSYNCMVYKGSSLALGCWGKSKLHKCHRFDQSVLGIIMTRLFHEQRRVVEFDVAPILNITRNARSNYFQDMNKLR